MVSRTEVSSFLDGLRGAIRADNDAHDLQESFDPLQNFVDWLDEPDKVVETPGHTIYVWSPVRLTSSGDISELAVVDFGASRGIYLRRLGPTLGRLPAFCPTFSSINSSIGPLRTDLPIPSFHLFPVFA